MMLPAADRVQVNSQELILELKLKFFWCTLVKFLAFITPSCLLTGDCEHASVYILPGKVKVIYAPLANISNAH